MAGIMLAWGGYMFHQKGASYNELDRSTSWRWGSQERLNREPARQFVGKGDDTITVSGTIYPLYNPGGSFIGTRKIEPLRQLADEGEPNMLIDGRGYVYGKYVVTNVQEQQSVIADNGGARKQGLTVTFEKYGEDG